MKDKLSIKVVAGKQLEGGVGYAGVRKRHQHPYCADGGKFSNEATYKGQPTQLEDDENPKEKAQRHVVQSSNLL